MLILLCCRKVSAMWWHHEKINSCKKVLYIHQHAFSPELRVSGLMTPVELYILLEQNIKGWSNCCQTASSSNSWCRVTKGQQQQQLLAQVTKTVTLNKDCCWSTADCCYLHWCRSDLTHDAALLTLFHCLRGTNWMFRSPAGRRPTMQQLRRPSRFPGSKYMKDLLIVTQHSCCMLVVLVLDWTRPNPSALYYRSFDFSLTTAAHLQSNHSR